MRRALTLAPVLARHLNAGAASAQLRPALLSALQLQQQHFQQQQEPFVWQWLEQQQQQQLHGQRTFASTALGAKETAQALDTAAAVLAQGNVLKLRQELEELATQNAHTTFSTFAKLAAQTGAAKTHAEAEQLADVLQKACILLRHEDLVYLKPEEIVEALMLMMPTHREAAEQKLEEVEAELKELQALHERMERQANKRTDLMLSLGLVVLLTQLVAFAYLTWWELSWDVMEPIGYMISLFYSCCAYFYFMITRGSQLDLGPFKEFWSKKMMSSEKSKLAFDQARWDFLVRQRERVQRHLGMPHQILRSVATKL